MMNLADVHYKHEYPVAIIVIFSSFFFLTFSGASVFLPDKFLSRLRIIVLVLSSFTNTSLKFAGRISDHTEFSIVHHSTYHSLKSLKFGV